jgi:ABC-type cobalamin/Fe3+-siderophores transport system ATPase subunit
MSIKIKFPKNEDVELEQGKPVVILGANGSGKTRLSVKIEELNDKRFNNHSVDADDLLIHRLSAQKSLTISDTISLSDYESSRDALFYGGTNENSPKWIYRYGQKPVTHLLDDYNKVLAMLFAEENMELQKAHEADKRSLKNGKERPQIIITIIEKATIIWNELLPQRTIDLTGGGVHVNYNNGKYHGKEMSDGERVMLYLICQALILPRNSILIIDEPEIHIHKAIVKKLWDKLEQERPDCVFVYITHDLDFAASRKTDKFLWVRSFDGNTWDYEFLTLPEFEELPNELLYEIIGTRKKILFVEGDRNSYDHILYNEFYKDKNYHIIPCGGCSEALKIYKSKKAYEKLNSIEAHCLIDRDFRTDTEIADLRAKDVNILEVAEVENLFVVPALLDIMGEQFACVDAVQQAKDFIIELFGNTKAGQIGEAFVKEINHQLAKLKIENKRATPNEIQSHITSNFSIERIQNFFDEKQAIYDNLDTVDKVLKVFNFKDLRNKVGKKLGVQDYPQRVINLLQSNQNGIRERILSALKPYIPDLP